MALLAGRKTLAGAQGHTGVSAILEGEKEGDEWEEKEGWRKRRMEKEMEKGGRRRRRKRRKEKEIYEGGRRMEKRKEGEG